MRIKIHYSGFLRQGLTASCFRRSRELRRIAVSKAGDGDMDGSRMVVTSKQEQLSNQRIEEETRVRTKAEISWRMGDILEKRNELL
jgi:hypothetical protein